MFDSNGQLVDSYSLPDGTTDSKTLGPDPVWGLQVPVTTRETVTLGSLTMNITDSRSITLGTAGNPFSVTKENDIQTLNGRSYTSTFAGSTRTWLNKSPVGRTLTIAMDPLERVSSTQLGTLAATHLTYDGHGRIATSTQGTRKTTFSYNAEGFLATFRRKSRFWVKASGRRDESRLAVELARMVGALTRPGHDRY